MPGETSFTLAEADWVAAHRGAFLALVNWRFARMVLIIALLAAGVMTAAQLLGGEGPRMAIVIGAMMAAIIGILLPLCALINYLRIAGRARRLFGQNKLLRYPQIVTWNDDELRVSSVRGSLGTRLTDYHHWRESKGVFLLYTDEAMFHLVPQRALDAGQVADLRATLVAHGPPRR